MKKLTEKDCDEFRALPCSFNLMVKTIYNEGQLSALQELNNEIERQITIVEDYGPKNSLWDQRCGLLVASDMIEQMMSSNKAINSD